MSDLSNLFKTVASLHIKSNGTIKEYHIDASYIYRYSALASDDKMPAKQERNESCTRIFHRKGDVSVLETPMEVKQRIEEAEDRIFERMRKSRLLIPADFAKPIIVLNTKDGSTILQRHFDARAIVRYFAEYSAEKTPEMRAKNRFCAKVFYDGSSSSIQVLETPDEIKQQIEDAEDNIIRRMQKAQLSAHVG